MTAFAFARGEPEWLVRAHRPVAAALVSGLSVGPSDVVLDVAAGTGTVVRLALARGATVVAVDLSPHQVRTGLARTPSAAWAVADAEALPFASGSFSRVASNLGLVYAADPVRAVSELRRVLAPGGRAAFSAHDPDGFGPSAAALINRYLFGGAPAVTAGAAPAGLAARPFDVHEEHASVEAFWTFSVRSRRHVRHLARTLRPGPLAAFRREYCDLALRHAVTPGFRLRHAYVIASWSAPSGHTADKSWSNPICLR